MEPARVTNWKGSISYQPASLQIVHDKNEIVEIVRNRQKYPSPVRVKGSHHSTTDCVVAEGGTVIDVTRMNRIIAIDAERMTITMQAGVRHIDAARELAKHGLQFYVNIELGNLTVGSGACGATKDASYIVSTASDNSGHTTPSHREYGQVSSYCTGVKTVQADGTVRTITSDDGELMEMMRGSYGLLGVIFEVTYQVKKLRPMVVEHETLDVNDFADRLDTLLAQNKSVMLYLFPFLNRVTIEYRYDGKGAIRTNSWQWRLRNWVWKTGSPAVGRITTTLIPFRHLHNVVLNRYNRFSQWVMTRILRGTNTSPADQIILYPDSAGFAAYTFSIWAFPQESYPSTIKAYYRFCREYWQTHGYRCDLLNVGYAIAQDRQSIFSYTRRGPALTLDPVSTGSRGWEAFLTAYNQFCSDHNGVPLFNQTRGITPRQAQLAFADEIRQFNIYRRQADPDNRFLTPYFDALLQDA